MIKPLGLSFRGGLAGLQFGLYLYDLGRICTFSRTVSRVGVLEGFLFGPQLQLLNRLQSREELPSPLHTYNSRQ